MGRENEVTSYRVSPQPGLLRCPFCYSEATFGEVAGRDHPDFGGHFINCTNERCQACIGLRYAGKEDPRPLLAEQWNRRANPEPSSLVDDEDERGFTPSDYAHTAALLRSSEAIRKATASNNHNVILAALDLCAQRLDHVPCGTEKVCHPSDPHCVWPTCKSREPETRGEADTNSASIAEGTSHE